MTEVVGLNSNEVFCSVSMRLKRQLGLSLIKMIIISPLLRDKFHLGYVAKLSFF